MNSLRSRLLVSLVLGTLVVLLLGGGGLYWFMRQSLIGQQDRLLESRARSITLLVSYEHGRVEFEQDDDLTNDAKDTLFSVEDPNGTVLRQSPLLGGHTLARRSLLETAEPGDSATFDVELPGDEDGRALSIVFVPRVDAEEEPELESLRRQCYIVTVAGSVEPIERAMSVLVSALVGIGLAVLGTIAVVLWVGIRYALVPVDQLGAAMRRTDALTPEPIATPTHCPSELRPVYTELDRLIERIRSAMEWERLFADATAHELRTPIAELRTVTEVAERWPEEEDPKQAFGEARMIADEMDRMIESLLTMTRSRGLELPPGTEAISLAPIVDRIVKSTENHQRGLDVEVKLDQFAAWRAPEWVAELIARNIITNAFAHTPAGGHVEIAVRDDGGGQAAFIVRNGPVDLDPEDITHLAKPFWRKDAARSDRDHVGLGLSVVERMAEVVGLVFIPTIDTEHKILSIRIAPAAACDDRTCERDVESEGDRP